jgi:GT2 family glycosyltransferase
MIKKKSMLHGNLDKSLMNTQNIMTLLLWKHACIFIRKSAYEKVGGYEPKIFMYAEDVELSYRFRAFGYHLRYCPNAVVLMKKQIKLNLYNFKEVH